MSGRLARPLRLWSSEVRSASMASTSPAFLLRYQRPVPASDAADSATAGTMTKTSARESSDQDVSAWMTTATQTFTETRERRDQDPAHVCLGTQTQTATREQADRDPVRRAGLGTQTYTDSREASDNDPSYSGWSILPRA